MSRGKGGVRGGELERRGEGPWSGPYALPLTDRAPAATALEIKNSKSAEFSKVFIVEEKPTA